MSEFIAGHYAVRAILPLHEGFFGNRDFGTHRPLCLQVDNSTVLRISRTGVSQQLAMAEVKPMAVRLGLLQDLRELGVLRVVHVRTDVNRADALTKALDQVKLEKACELFGMVNLRVARADRIAYTARQLSVHRIGTRNLFLRETCSSERLARARRAGVPSRHAPSPTVS